MIQDGGVAQYGKCWLVTRKTHMRPLALRSSESSVNEKMTQAGNSLHCCCLQTKVKVLVGDHGYAMGWKGVRGSFVLYIDTWGL